MPFNCCVRTPHKISQPLFSVPKDESKKKLWEESLGMVLKKSHHICATHFNECDMIEKWISGSGASKYTVSIQRHIVLQVLQNNLQFNLNNTVRLLDML